MQKNKSVRRKAPHFDLSGGVVCLDFINTLDDRPTGQPNELLASYKDLAWFGEETGILDKNQAGHFFKDHDIEAEQALLGRAIKLREALYAIFTAVVGRKAAPADALQVLNGCLHAAEGQSVLREMGRHFLWSFADRFSYDAILWPIARSAADLLVSDELRFVRTCSSDTCQWFFLDTSKNHRRRWCNMKLCGNRAKVQRFYERQKKAEQ